MRNAFMTLTGPTLAYVLREAGESDIHELVEIIRSSFQDVALRFRLTEENCPKHPSNCRDSWIAEALNKGIRYFMLDVDGASCGCVALEQANPEVCYLERLAVLPHQRQRGFGKALVDHVLWEAGQLNARRVEIGIIADQTELREWYRRIGFLDGKKAAFPHLPFQVLFMVRTLDDPACRFEAVNESPCSPRQQRSKP